MTRGQTSEVGTTRVAKNGYHYTKTEDRGWVLTHWLTMEKHLGRQIDTTNETVRFLNKKAKEDPYSLEGLILVKRRAVSLRQRRARIEHRIQELQAELEIIDSEIEKM